MKNLMMLKVVGNPLESIMSGVRGTATTVASGTKSVAKKMLVGILLCTVIVWVAILLYISFYRAYVPTATIVRPAHFKFRVCPSGVGMCTFPMANITLGLENKPEVLGHGQQYQVLMQMQVPDSTPNRDLGMFMVMIRMYDRYGVITQESSRAVALKYQSDLSKIIQTVVFWPLYITGFAEETQTLKINLFDFFWDDYYQPSVGVLLEIHSRQLVFYSANLHFHATYFGLRHYLFHYPLCCAILGVLFNCLWLTPTLLVPWYTNGLGLINGLNNRAAASANGYITGQGGRIAPQGVEQDGRVGPQAGAEERFIPDVGLQGAEERVAPRFRGVEQDGLLRRGEEGERICLQAGAEERIVPKARLEGADERLRPQWRKAEEDGRVGLPAGGGGGGGGGGEDDEGRGDDGDDEEGGGFMEVERPPEVKDEAETVPTNFRQRVAW